MKLRYFYINDIKLLSLVDYQILLNLDEIILNMRNNDIIFISPSKYHSLSMVHLSQKIKEASDKLFINVNVVLLTNTQEEVDFYQEKVAENDVLYCNRNAFLDEYQYSTNESMDREYDLILNCAFVEFKNTKYAHLCKNTIHIGYDHPNKEIIIPIFGKLANYNENGEFKFLNKSTILKHMHNSYVGGIFSTNEGQCRASSEYLLAGLPVVSCESVGGRDVWYNRDNSIIVPLDENEIYLAVKRAKEMVLKGDFNGEKIRNNHILESQKHRDRLLKYINGRIYNDKPITYEDLRPSFHLIFKTHF